MAIPGPNEDYKRKARSAGIPADAPPPTTDSIEKKTVFC